MRPPGGPVPGPEPEKTGSLRSSRPRSPAARVSCDLFLRAGPQPGWPAGDRHGQRHGSYGPRRGSYRRVPAASRAGPSNRGRRGDHDSVADLGASVRNHHADLHLHGSAHPEPQTGLPRARCALGMDASRAGRPRCHQGGLPQRRLVQRGPGHGVHRRPEGHHRPHHPRRGPGAHHHLRDGEGSGRCWPGHFQRLRAVHHAGIAHRTHPSSGGDGDVRGRSRSRTSA
jgi:hypothetical protein